MNSCSQEMSRSNPDACAPCVPDRRDGGCSSLGLGSVYRAEPVKIGVCVVALVLGVLVAGCSTGPSSAETAACAAILKLSLPPGAGHTGEESVVSIGLPTNTKHNLINSGDPILTRFGRTMGKPDNGASFEQALPAAQAECRKLGVG